MTPAHAAADGAGECTHHDAVVVGGGAAGLAAATWLARFRRAVLVLDSGEYRARAVERSHGYLGSDPVPPMRLLERARADLLAYPTAQCRAGRAVAVRPGGPGFRVRYDTANGVRVAECCRLVLATGTADVLPDVAGVAEHYGASVFHCPACDGYDARGRDVVALGWDARLASFATTLLDWARSVTLVTGGRPFEGDPAHRAALDRLGIEVIEGRVEALVGTRGDLREVRLADGRALPASLFFFSVAHRPRTALATALGCELDPDGYVQVDSDGQTTVPGVYAAGDLVPGLQLLQVAAAKGTIAGVAAALSLHGRTGVASSPTPAPDLEAVVGEVADGH